MDYLNRLNEGWRDLMDNKADPRTTDWFLMSSPLPTIAMCLGYVFIVKVRKNSEENFRKNLDKNFLPDSRSKTHGKQKTLQA